MRFARHDGVVHRTGKAALSRCTWQVVLLHLAAAFLLSSAACDKKSAGVAVSAQTRDMYAQRCEVCHGRSGDGRGVQASSMAVPPPDWTDSSWQDQASDADIRAAIVSGGAANGKSSAMPAHPDLADTVILAELVQLVRSPKATIAMSSR
jgi:cytochrome c